MDLGHHCGSFLLFSRTFSDILRHVRGFDVKLESANVLFTLLWSFWWLNERSSLYVKY